MFLAAEKRLPLHKSIASWSQHVVCVVVDILFLFAGVTVQKRSWNLSRLPSHWYYLFVVNIFSHTVCKHSMPIGVIWRLAFRVFPSSVKYNHLDSPANLLQFMERYTNADTFRDAGAAVRQSRDVNVCSGRTAGRTVP